MDPTTCWNEMLDALCAGDRGLANDKASALYDWLRNGGFCPQTKAPMMRVHFERVAIAVMETCGAALPEGLALDLEMTKYIVDLHERNPGQMSVDEYGSLADRIVGYHGCKLLVFGCGRDSELWTWANHKGETVFIEHSTKWAESAHKTITEGALPRGDFKIRAVKYHTLLERWQQDITEPLDLFGMSDMPKDYFDIVIVDAPPGAGKNAPGRMQSIYEAGRRVTREGWIYVHDMKRPVEKAVTAMLLVKELGFKKTRVTENLAAFRRP